jgi:hypothetical protein
MNCKTSITLYYSESAGILLSFERSNKVVRSSLRPSHDLTTHASITGNTIEIIVKSAKNCA